MTVRIKQRFLGILAISAAVALTACGGGGGGDGGSSTVTAYAGNYAV